MLIGRLTQDPESRSTPSGQSVTTLRMATNSVWNDRTSGQKKESTEFHTVIAWGRLGEIASQYLKRGATLMIEGRLQTRNWVGKDNLKRYTTEIIAENLQMGPRSSTGSEQAGGSFSDIKPPSGHRPTAHSTSSTQAARDESAEPEIPIIDENELTRHGVEESEVSLKDDLPF